MSRLQAMSDEASTEKARELLEGVHSKMKMIPNFLRVMANSPAVLEGYLAFNTALSQGSLPPKLREKIALAVGEANGCEYCLSAHTVLGRRAGLDQEEIEEARASRASSPRDSAALVFVQTLLSSRGQAEAQDFDALRSAGFGDAEIAEIIAHIALNVFTNYFNIANQVEVDFPRVSLRTAA